MKRLLVLLLVWLASFDLRAVSGAVIPNDLGDGLGYVRIHALPADLPSSAEKPHAMVLDLRYAKADRAAVAALGAWLQFHSSVRAPVFVLVNAATDSLILDFFEGAGPIPGLMTLGPASSKYVPDISVRVTPAIERTAYDALENNATFASLLTDLPGKPRYDEEAIAKEHAGSSAAEEDSDGPLSDVPATATAAAPKPPPPLVDATLQRAQQVYRALRALRKL
ncbi:MAG: hypothetical protein JWM88_1125 [Verrucomicrobia bacterium]|nr:hypothetical protein [Verrucomicrobiota bacterium]